MSYTPPVLVEAEKLKSILGEISCDTFEIKKYVKDAKIEQLSKLIAKINEVKEKYLDTRPIRNRIETVKGLSNKEKEFLINIRVKEEQNIFDKKQRKIIKQHKEKINALMGVNDMLFAVVSVLKFEDNNSFEKLYDDIDDSNSKEINGKKYLLFEFEFTSETTTFLGLLKLCKLEYTIF